MEALGDVSRHLGAVLEALGRVLEDLGGVLEALERVLEALERVVEALGIFLEAKTSQDGPANLLPCWPPKSMIFRIFGSPRGLQNFKVLRVDFKMILVPSWPPTWEDLAGHHVGSKNGVGKFRCYDPKEVRKTTLLFNTV